MKRLLLYILTLSIAIATSAQSSRMEIDARPHLAISTHSIYAGQYYLRPLADAPKGFKPFYISHYGRHGSRYESKPQHNESVVEIFRIADSLAILTATGKEAKAMSEKIARTQHLRHGELTQIGYEQHKGIARRMYHRFREVFKRGAIINGRSSTSSRCVLSMAAFNESLKECEPLIETRVRVSQLDQNAIRPMSKEATEYHHSKRHNHPDEWFLELSKWGAKQDLSHAATTLFTDIKSLCGHLGEDEIAILSNIYKRLAFVQNLDWHDRSLLDTIFSAAERHTIYKYENFKLFCRYAGTTLPEANRYFAPIQMLVDDIIEYADLAIEGKSSASADLRFGHDYYLLGLLATANFNEVRMDWDYSDIDKLAENWRSHHFMTMASNTQFVFYRSKKSPEVLVRMLHNENDVTLPIECATAPFYKWEDVKRYLVERYNAFRR